MDIDSSCLLEGARVRSKVRAAAVNTPHERTAPS